MRTRRAPSPDLRKAEHCYAKGEYAAGAAAARNVLAKQKANVEAMYLLGSCETQLANYESGRRILEKAVSIRPGLNKCYVPLSFCQRMLGRTDEALATLDRSLSIDPRHEPSIASKAVLLLALGRTEETDRLLAPVVERGFKDHQIAIAWAQLRRRQGRPADAIPLLEPAARNEAIPPGLRIDALFTLADLLDRAGRYDEAFAAYRDANALKQLRFPAREHAAAADRVIASFTPEVFQRLAALAPDETDHPTPIFIVGMPRSGTTLAERILGAHPDVFAAGELPIIFNAAKHIQQGTPTPMQSLFQHPSLLSESVIAMWRRMYLEHIPDGAKRSPFFTDKLPGNALNLHFARLLFPDAPIVHCVRNPADTGLSCYFQNFGSTIDFAYDLDSIAAFYRDYARLMRHHTGTLGIPALEFVYEDVVADLDTAARRLVGHCGLQWHDDCLAFHTQRTDARTRSAEQVQNPIYTSSVRRYQHYADHIAPLLDLLDDPVSFATGRDRHA